MKTESHSTFPETDIKEMEAAREAIRTAAGKAVERNGDVDSIRELVDAQFARRYIDEAGWFEARTTVYLTLSERIKLLPINS